MVVLSILCGILYYKWQKNVIGAILTALLLSVIPMPSDKFLEIRPDPLAMCFFIGGLILILISDKRKSRKLFFTTGFFFSLSLLTLQKVLPYICLSSLFVIFQVLTTIKNVILRRSLLFAYFIGIFLPLFGFTIWAISTGNPQIVFYSVTKLPIEVSEVFRPILPPLLFYFMPNNIYYGQGGYTLGNIFNSTVWILGIASGILLLVFSLFHRIKSFFQKKPARFTYDFSFLMCLMVISSLVIYRLSVIRFPQYLIPASIFISILTIYLLMQIVLLIKKVPGGFWISSATILSVTALMVHAFMYVMTPKLAWNNESYFKRMNSFFDKVPTSEYVLDLDGITLYYPYPYYMCCLPWPIVPYPSHPMPSLKAALAKTHTNYIYEGVTDWVRFFDRFDSDYLHQNFVQEPGKEYWIRKKTN
jgi:hypothetical protein